MIVLEVVDQGEPIGTLTLADDGTVSAEPEDLESIVLTKYRLQGIADEKTFEDLRPGWSNGYWSVREKDPTGLRAKVTKKRAAVKT